MSQTDQQIDLAGARHEIDGLCGRVGFSRAPLDTSTNSETPHPDGTTLWISNYAQLLLWPCPGNDQHSLQAAVDDGQSWFDQFLLESEKQGQGRPIDGYLVLALPHAPESSTLEDVRRIELSSQVCRKHLIWPTNKSDVSYQTDPWQRLADITVLGLPEAEATATNEVQWPEMDGEAQDVWNDLVAFGVSAAVFRDGGA